MADWNDVIDLFIARLDPHVPELSRLQTLFNEEQNIALADAKEALMARFQYHQWVMLGPQTDAANIESRRQTAREIRRLGTIIELQAQRRIGQCLLANPPSRNRPKKTVRTADSYVHLPQWLKRQDAGRYRELAKISPEDWFDFLVQGFKKDKLSLRAAWDFADDKKGERITQQNARETEAANKKFFGVSKKSTKTPKGAKRSAPSTTQTPTQAIQEASYEKICRIFHGDFIGLDMTALPVQQNEKPQAIITDPPYKDEFFVSGLWKRFAEWSQNNLAKNGVLAVMVGTQWLDRAMTTMLDAGWKYRWTISVKYKWFDFNHGKRVMPLWKPVLVFQFPDEKIPKYATIDGDFFTVCNRDVACPECNHTWNDPNIFFGEKPDVFKAGKRVKNLGEWQQDLETFERLVDYFTRPDQLVCDPFTGYGTTAVACIKTARRFVGAEILPDRWKKADREARAAFRKMQCESQ